MYTHKFVYVRIIMPLRFPIVVQKCASANDSFIVIYIIIYIPCYNYSEQKRIIIIIMILLLLLYTIIPPQLLTHIITTIIITHTLIECPLKYRLNLLCLQNVYTN